MSGNGEPNEFHKFEKKPETIEDIKEFKSEFLDKLNDIANKYKKLYEKIEENRKKVSKEWNDYFLDDNEKDKIDEIYREFIDITKKYVKIFHEGIKIYDDYKNNHKNDYKISSLKQNISETLGGTTQESTSKNITEEIEELIKQLKKLLLDKYLTYKYNENTGKVEHIRFILPPSTFGIEPEFLELKAENIDFVNSNSKNLTEFFFLGNYLRRIIT